MTEQEQNTEQLRAHAAFLLSQAKQESFDIQRALGAASADGTLQSRLAAAAAQISGAISQLSQALGSSSFPLRAADISALESVVTSGETAALLSEAQQAASAAVQARNLTAASVAVRQEVQSLSDDLFEKKIFDPYLHFRDAEDEAEYRKRQAEAQRYINEQLAKNTPQGNLNASDRMVETMRDAKAHGAGDSPDFLPRWNALLDTNQRLRTAMQADGTERGNRNTSRVEGEQPLPSSAPLISRAATASPDGALTDVDFNTMDAKLKAAGLEPPRSTEATGHGLAITKPPAKDGQIITD